MLDLKSLEKKIDNVLENETSESLSNWLLSKRLKNYSAYLGEGIIESVSGRSSGTFRSTKSNNPMIDSEQAIDFSNCFNYQQAA